MEIFSVKCFRHNYAKIHVHVRLYHNPLKVSEALHLCIKGCKPQGVLEHVYEGGEGSDCFVFFCFFFGGGGGGGADILGASQPDCFTSVPIIMSNVETRLTQARTSLRTRPCHRCVPINNRRVLTL